VRRGRGRSLGSKGRRRSRRHGAHGRRDAEEVDVMVHMDGGAKGSESWFLLFCFMTGGPVAALATNRTLDRLSLKDDGVAEDIKNVVADCLRLNNRLARRQVPVCRLRGGSASRALGPEAPPPAQPCPPAQPRSRSATSCWTHIGRARVRGGLPAVARRGRVACRVDAALIRRGWEQLAGPVSLHPLLPCRRAVCAVGFAGTGDACPGNVNMPAMLLAVVGTLVAAML
jgi:hypothetical protein